MRHGDDRPVATFRGPIGARDAAVVADLVEAAVDSGVPVVGVIEQMGITSELELLGGWGAVARSLSRASGVVPTALVLDGPCLGGPALAVGLVDLVVLTDRAKLHVNTPKVSRRMTGMNDAGSTEGASASPGGNGANGEDDVDEFGDMWHHLSTNGLATAGAEDADEALALVADVLSFLPSNNQAPPPAVEPADPPDRSSTRAAAVVPKPVRASYDVREVISDLVDDEDFVELYASFGTSLTVGFGRIAGQPVGVVANQPSQLAGALDIASSLKGARFVRWCDSFNIPLLTLVDTPGFRPGRDQEWQGIVRHGAKLAYAYAEATVPRVSVVLRKAYGGAYIVMDCKAMGSDCTLAWPLAEIAVMGAQGAVGILHRGALAEGSAAEQAQRREILEAEYAAEHLSPRVAFERGFVDAVIDPETTRRTLAEAFASLATKHRGRPERRHDNIPL